MMSWTIGLVLALAIPAAPAATPDIVVEGRLLTNAYHACVQGGCTPLRDAQVSIAFAEQQFRRGAYLDAKQTLAKAVSRNRTQAAAAPPSGRGVVRSLRHGRPA